MAVVTITFTDEDKETVGVIMESDTPISFNDLSTATQAQVMAVEAMGAVTATSTDVEVREVR